MTIVNQIEEAEKQLMEYIEERVIDSIQKFCQWRMCYELYQEQSEKEYQMILKYSEEVKEWLENNTPLHAQSMYYPPLAMVTNDNKWTYYQYECEKWHKSSSSTNPVCFWVCITYKDFEENGYSKDFAKRVVEKFETAGQLKRKRGIFGYTYSVSNPSELSEYIKPSRKALELTQQDLHDFPGMEWILDQYTNEELEIKFNKYKEIVFREIEEGIQYKDSIKI